MDVVQLNRSTEGEHDPVKDVRRAFAFHRGRLYLQAEGDNRPMAVALKAEVGLSGECLGGFYDYSNIVFFRTDGHGFPQVDLITENICREIWWAMKVHGDVAVWAGVVKGEVGTLWPTKMLLGYFNQMGEYKKIERG